MDHQPYEAWLLNDERLNKDQDRELRLHVRGCAECAALASANLALRSAPVTAPATGFKLRFKSRLAAQRKIEQRRSVIGLFLLAMVGSAGLLFLLSPYLNLLTLSPSQLASLWVGNLVYLALSARVLGIISIALLNIIGSLIPPFVWALSIVVLVGAGFLWAFSFRRVGRYMQSAV